MSNEILFRIRSSGESHIAHLPFEFWKLDLDFIDLFKIKDQALKICEVYSSFSMPVELLSMVYFLGMLKKKRLLRNFLNIPISITFNS